MSTKTSEENSPSSKIQVLHGGDAKGQAPSVPLEPKGSKLGAKLLIGFWLSVLGVAALLFFFGERYHGNVFGPKAMMKKADTLAALRVSLLKSVESEQRAVMADTDEASRAYAEESRKASEVVNAQRDELAELIKLYPAEDENRLLQEFDESWQQLRRLDQQILELAVQNTNLKATALSFGQATETLHRFQAVMQKITQDADNIKTVRLTSDALSAMLIIQTLHAPHIASADDGQMSRIEQTIGEQEQVVRRSLDQLETILPADRRQELKQGTEAFNEYAAITQKVIELSRQNTNVTSLEISLNRKLKMTAQCDVILGKLQEAIMGREFKATR